MPSAAAASGEALIGVYRQAHARLVAAYQQVVDDPLKWRQERRLRELIRTSEAEIDRLMGVTRDWWSTQPGALYQAGAHQTTVALGSPYTWTSVQQEAVEAFTRRTWIDVAARLRHIGNTTRSALRAMAADSTRAALLESRTAVQAGRDMAREAAKRGLWSVEYRNGAKHTMRDYSQMLIRTTTATAYNTGALDQMRSEGIDHVEYRDGPDCGVTSHDDPQKADGLIVHIDDVVQLAHPNCRRALLPAPFATSTGYRPEGRAPLGAEPAAIPMREPREPRTPRRPRASRNPV